MHIGQMLTKSQHYQKYITQQGDGRPIMSVQMQWHPVQIYGQCNKAAVLPIAPLEHILDED